MYIWDKILVSLVEDFQQRSVSPRATSVREQISGDTKITKGLAGREEAGEIKQRERSLSENVFSYGNILRMAWTND